MSNLAQLNRKYYNELINRLFHPDSYFYDCISKNISRISEIDEPGHKEIVFLIQNLINRLVESESAIGELMALSHLKGFQHFNLRLKGKIESTNFSGGTPEKMKEIINSISHFVIHQLRAILKDANHRRSIAKFLTLESSLTEDDDVINRTEIEHFSADGQPEIVTIHAIPASNQHSMEDSSKSEICDVSHLQTEALEEPVDSKAEMDIHESLINEAELSIEHQQELPEQNPAYNCHDSLSEDKNIVDDKNINENKPDTTDSECNKIESVQSTALLDDYIDNRHSALENYNPTLIPNPLFEGIKTSEQDNDEVQDINFHLNTEARGLGLTSETIDDNCKEEIFQAFKHVAKYDAKPDSIKNHSRFMKDWEKCAEQIRMTTMMYGYDEIEAIATRMLRITCHHKVSLLKPDQYTLKLLIDGKNAIQEIVFKQQSGFNIQELLHSFDQYLKRSTIPAAKKEESETESDSETTNSKISDAVDLNETIDSNESVDSIQINEQSDDAEIHDKEFKIPGEDDPELLALINEISYHKGNVFNNSNVNESNRDHSVELTATINPEPIIQISEEQVNESLEINNLFNIEASLYFKLINSALKKLIQNNNNESALEDLELASSSLKSQALQFGFEHLSELPHIIEKIANESIEQEKGIPENILVRIAETIILVQTFNEDAKGKDKFKILRFELSQYLKNLIKQKKALARY